MIDFVFYMPVNDNMNFDDGCPLLKLKRKIGVPVVVSKNADNHYKKKDITGEIKWHQGFN